MALLLCLAFGAGGLGCAEDDAGGTTGDDANFTVASGDRFIVSATSEKIVFRKNIGAAPFPFDEQSLAGKAILIHPVAGRAEDGVYSRVKTVRSEGDTYVVDATPLSFLDMEGITEDEIVRIYVDPKRATPNGEATLSTTSFAPPLNFDSGLQLWPQNETPGFGIDHLGVGPGANTPIARTDKLGPGISFKQTIDKASFSPSFLVDWSRERGLELGFRADMEWKSKAVINGTLTGEFFRSNAWESPALWVTVPLGVATVPVRASVRVLITCKATLTGPADMTLDVDASARVGGSFRIRPSTNTAPTEWVGEGPWPGEATGSASVHPTFSLAFGGAIFCALPRIELHTKVFGLVGPVVIAMPGAVVDDAGVRAEVRFYAGLEAGIFGIGAGMEVPVYTMKL
jgi:hypothetical protein